MALRVQHICSRCHRHCKREEMMAKKALFTTIGAPVRTIRSRTKEWLCPECVSKDPDYNSEPGSTAPGYTTNNLARG